MFGLQAALPRAFLALISSCFSSFDAGLPVNG